MYAIKEEIQKINGEIVETFEREIVEPNTWMRVEAGTTGFTGDACRDAGGRTYLCIECRAGDFHFEPVINEDGRVVGIEVACCGDAALEALMKALEFADAALIESHD